MIQYILSVWNSLWWFNIWLEKGGGRIRIKVNSSDGFLVTVKVKLYLII
jgi:hypothetical protein